MTVKELYMIMREQTRRNNNSMHIVLGFEDDETYFSTWLPELEDLNRPGFIDRFIRSMWYDHNSNTLCLTVSGGIA